MSLGCHQRIERQNGAKASCVGIRPIVLQTPAEAYSEQRDGEEGGHVRLADRRRFELMYYYHASRHRHPSLLGDIPGAPQLGARRLYHVHVDFHAAVSMLPVSLLPGSAVSTMSDSCTILP